MELRPADIAKECGVSVGTVRNWCAEYAEFLSSGANPSDGNRLLSERDLEICRYIARLRKEGMSKPQLILRLRETTFGHVDTELPITKPTESLQSLQESHKDIPAVIMALQAMQNDIEALKASSKVTATSRRDTVQVFVLGFLAACGLFVLLLLLAVLYGGFR